MNVRGRGDREIESASPGLAAAVCDGSVQTSALACYGCVNRESVEVRLDRAETTCAQRPGGIVSGDEDTEVQLGE